MRISGAWPRSKEKAWPWQIVIEIAVARLELVDKKNVKSGKYYLQPKNPVNLRMRNQKFYLKKNSALENATCQELTILTVAVFSRNSENRAGTKTLQYKKQVPKLMRNWQREIQPNKKRFLGDERPLFSDAGISYSAPSQSRGL